MGLKLKQIPKNVQEAQGRFVGMKKIDADEGVVVDYGNKGDKLTSATAEAKNKEYLDFLAEYNLTKKELDTKRAKIGEMEKELVSMGNRVLAGARSKFGFDSPQVETLGGVPTSSRKQPRKKDLSLNPGVTKVA